ncbi:helix-turn-helix transcriptional regulator [Pseudomonas japonica]|uniref:helix-turn-helix domain-containing protein n=1 Tax=Pseudomonas japonica TaxID=256466 RepID=UPI00380876AC
MPRNAPAAAPLLVIEPPTLTPREEEVLYWCSCGKTSWEISQIIACKESTVNFHVGNVLRKLSVHSRVEAVIKALRYGLLARRIDRC